jgi:hypothetical protein
MSSATWAQVYVDAWKRYYSDEHVGTVMRRAVASGLNRHKVSDLLTFFSGSVHIEAVHPLQFGFGRRKGRTQRRPGMRIPHALLFYPWRALDCVETAAQWLHLYWRYRRMMARVAAAPNASTYSDSALRPPTGSGEPDDLIRAFADKIPRIHGASESLSAAT